MPVMKTEFEREELFKLSWKKPISWFSKNYLVSYQEFKNVCRQNQIPLPPNGYWMKRKYGKEVSKPELPKTDKTEIIELILRTEENTKQSKRASKLISINKDLNSCNLQVPNRLPKNPDPIIQEMLSTSPKEHPVINNTWDYTKRYNYGRISVGASGKAYKRALCFLNTFINVMKSRGHYFLFCYERSYVVIEGIEIALRMRERNKRVYETEKSGYRFSKLVPTGLLSFITGEYSGKEWQETQTVSLAVKLPLIINYLEKSAYEERHWKVENEKRLKKEAIEKKKQEERERLQKEEIDKLLFLKHQSDLWHEAKKLKSFLDACNKNKNLTDEMKELVILGYQKVDWLNPLTPCVDELFNDRDPYKIFQNLK